MRFPEFSEEWKETTIAEECIVNPKTESLNSEFVYIDLESVVKGELLKETVINKLDAPSRAQRVLKNYDILFQCVRPYQMNNYIYRKQDDRQWVASTGYAQIRTNNNPYFIYHLLNTPKFNKEVMLRCTGTSYPAIASNDLSEIDIAICSRNEQDKIANLLSLLDLSISTQSQIIKELETLIKGLIYSFVRKNEVNVQLKDCLYSHSSTLMESAVIEKSGIYPVYGATGIIAHTPDYEIDEDAILIIKDGASVGKVQYAKDKYSVIGTLNYLTPKENISLKYFYYYLQIFNFEKHKVGSGIPHIYFKDYGNEYIYCPSIERQNEITNLLSAIDEKLETEKLILQKYTEQKKYLLANMFI